MVWEGSEIEHCFGCSSSEFVLSSAPISSVPTCEVLEFGGEVKGRVWIFCGVLGDVSIEGSWAAMTRSGDSLAEIDSIGGSGRGRIEGCSDGVFVYPGQIGKGNTCVRKIAGGDDVERISGKLGVEFDGEKGGAGCLKAVGGVRSGDAISCGPSCPGDTLRLGQSPEVGVCCF